MTNKEIDTIIDETMNAVVRREQQLLATGTALQDIAREQLNMIAMACFCMISEIAKRLPEEK